MAIIDNVVAFWSLDDATDAHGTNHLTNSTIPVTFIPGKIGSCGNFVRDSQTRLIIPDNAALSMGDIDFTIGCWLYLTSKPSAMMTFISKWNSSPGVSREYLLDWDNTVDRFRFVVSATGATGTTVVANNFGAPALDTWYFILAEHDAANNIITISGNGGTADTATHSTGVFNGTSNFGLGCLTLGSPQNHVDARIDQVFIKKSLFTPLEKTWLYNGDNGRSYAQMVAGIQPGDEPAATPTITPDSGIFSISVTVTLACTTPAAVIYYTTDGSSPDNTDTVYTAPFNLTVSATIRVIAYATGFQPSAVSSETYVVNPSRTVKWVTYKGAERFKLLLTES